MDDTRILTGAETATRRAEQASSAPSRAISTCAVPRCPRIAHNGEFCDEHRPRPGPRLVEATHLTNDDYASIAAEVEAKAAPLFLLAMDWIVRGQLSNLGVPQLAGPLTIHRTDR